jgi:asparagine synthase (glutamine-hydrolysing)
MAPHVASPIAPDTAAWQRLAMGNGWTAWASLYANLSAQQSRLQALLDGIGGPDTALVEIARGLYGHGGFLAHKPGCAVAMTDVVAAVPLYFAGEGSGTRLGADGNAVAAAAGARGRDAQAAFQLGLAGYTIGRRTLIPGLQSLKPGEIVTVDGSGRRHIRYARYLGAPDEAIDPADPLVMARHNEALLGEIERLAREGRGRTIMIPLSGGLDSRAIASGLKLLGCANVVCFSYGLPGNHEAEGAKRVAERLGYPWSFVTYDTQTLHAFFASATARRFFAFADRPDAMPFMQDVPAIERLIADRAIPEGAIIVNGQSGDYITGNHLPVSLVGPQAPEPISRDDLFHAVQGKHLDLWKCLEAPSAMEAIKAEIVADLGEVAHATMTRQEAAVAYELSEFDNRQSKYVVAGQRCYEMFGYDWRLPLWEPALVEYWRRMPLAAKLGRRLFATALEKANWGGVWGEDWRFPRTVVPAWVRVLRLGAKAVLAPAGRNVWHRVEKQAFEWFSDPILNYTIAPYRKVLLDRRGFRNALSWHAEAYLKRQGLSLAELVHAAGRT